MKKYKDIAKRLIANTTKQGEKERVQVLDKLQPDTVVHLAAVAHANQSNKNPHSTFDHSLRTLENALDSSFAQKALVHLPIKDG